MQIDYFLFAKRLNGVTIIWVNNHRNVTQVANKNTAGDDKGDYAISSDFQQSFL